MKPDCPHHSDCGVLGGGCCALGLFGGRPSNGICNGCEHNKARGRDLLAAAKAAPAAAKPRHATPERDAVTRAMWFELHMRAGGLGRIGLLLEPAWLDAWSSRVPCGDCQRNWSAWRQAHPADLRTPARHFAWTVAAHNAVNADLGKPPMPLADALRLYDCPPAWADELRDELRTANEGRSGDK